MAMIPENNIPVGSDIPEATINEKVDNTFKINDNGTVYGFIKGREALRQWVVTCLSVERFKYPIYSWNFGLQIEDLYGRDPFYVIALLEPRIREALTVDERVISLYDYAARVDKKRIHVRFTLETVFDNIQFEHTLEDIL